ncbi:MAG: hypothetical protein LBV27_07415 [Oscillospiraceae bacterium]|jgi:hypothetical protein|nr:hypothetical protein [Oscillospiraceae bacterium]
MPRRIKMLCVLSMALLTFCACGQTASSAVFTQDDFYLDIGGAEYRCDDDIQTVIENLGPDYAYSEAISCAYDGLDKTYDYDMAAFYTNPLEAGDMVSEIYTEDPAVSTSRGITVGDGRDHVLAAYGDGDDTGNMIIYRVPGEAGRGALCFEMENDAVIAIFITTEPV